MQASSTYKPNQSFGLLLVGEPKCGKTNLALAFPKPYILDADNNLGGASRRMGDTAFFFDILTVGADGSTIPKEKRWGRAMECLKEAIKSSEVQTIIIDSLAPLCDSLIDHILFTEQIEKMRIQDWLPFQTKLKQLIVALRASGKYIIVIAHSVADKDELSGALTWVVAMPGALRHNFAGYFSDVWTVRPRNVGGVLSYTLHTTPVPLTLTLGRSLSVAKQLDITDKKPKEIWAMLEKSFQ